MCCYSKTSLDVCWEPPSQHHFALNTDGSVSDTVAGFRGIIRTQDGSWFGGYYGTLKDVDILEAELIAILEGLRICWNRNLRNIKCMTDSTLEVNCIEQGVSNFHQLATQLVMELEEQLRIVTHQRKMAEKATADVLAILENQGISDASEEFDSGSDLENPYESGVSNESVKEGENSMSSKGRRHGSDELSGSHVDSSPVSSKSLSWKGRHDSPHSLEKYKTSHPRRQNSISSISSSPKHRQGKSCCKIRHRQSRSVMEESRDKSVKVNCQENEFVFSSEGLTNCSDGGSFIPRIESKIQEEDESEVNLVDKNHHVDGYERDKDMEKALEHQAQLIDQYEAMERLRENGKRNIERITAQHQLVIPRSIATLPFLHANSIGCKVKKL
ncbi:Ribonuclease H domain [Sesbania bispinosa]|nr:Ribonuclease H domain [Sesbania bispinosa]